MPKLRTFRTVVTVPPTNRGRPVQSRRTLLQRNITAVLGQSRFIATAAYNPGNLGVDESRYEQGHKVKQHQIGHEEIDVLLLGDAEIAHLQVRLLLIPHHLGQAEPGGAVEEGDEPHAVDDFFGPAHGAHFLRQHRTGDGDKAFDCEGQNTAG